MRLFLVRHLCHIASVSLWLLGGPTAFAEGAVRDLPASVLPSETFAVTITIDPPGGIVVAGLEDQPPPGWTVTNISASGSYDAQTMSVKWGPFFDPSIPALVTYDVTAPPSFGGSQCFVGTISFDGANEPVQGDACLSPPVPGITGWGLLTLSLLMVVAGQLVILRRN